MAIGKKKYCSGCDSEQYIWKNFEGNKYCKNCWGRIQSKDPEQKNVIPKVSEKRKKQDAEYLKLRERFLNDNFMCQLNYSCCTTNATDVHHTFAGSNRDAFYLVQSTWKASCRACHKHLHENPAEARILGYLK
jgi:hypothetical protein